MTQGSLCEQGTQFGKLDSWAPLEYWTPLDRNGYWGMGRQWMTLEDALTALNRGYM